MTKSGSLRLFWRGDGVVGLEPGLMLGLGLGLGFGESLESTGEGEGEGEDGDLVKKEVIWRC